jgi:hypothetical protein
LQHVRKYGFAANLQRARRGRDVLDVSIAAFSGLSLRALPESIFFVPRLPAHRAHPTPDQYQGRVASDHSCVSEGEDIFFRRSSWFASNSLDGAIETAMEFAI